MSALVARVCGDTTLEVELSSSWLILLGGRRFSSVAVPNRDIEDAEGHGTQWFHPGALLFAGHIENRYLSPSHAPYAI
jgi:hypothetical protein